VIIFIDIIHFLTVPNFFVSLRMVSKDSKLISFTGVLKAYIETTIF